MLWNRSSLAFLFVADSKSHAHSVTHSQLRKPQHTYVKRAVRKAHLNRAFKVVQGHPHWCRHKSRTVCRPNVQLMPALFLKLTTLLCKFNDPCTSVWRRSCKKRLRISRNDLHWQKLESLIYISSASPAGSIVFTFHAFLPRNALQCKARYCDCMSSVRLPVCLWRWWIVIT